MFSVPESVTEHLLCTRRTRVIIKVVLAWASRQVCVGPTGEATRQIRETPGAANERPEGHRARGPLWLLFRVLMLQLEQCGVG